MEGNIINTKKLIRDAEKFRERQEKKLEPEPTKFIKKDKTSDKQRKHELELAKFKLKEARARGKRFETAVSKEKKEDISTKGFGARKAIETQYDIEKEERKTEKEIAKELKAKRTERKEAVLSPFKKEQERAKKRDEARHKGKAEAIQEIDRKKKLKKFEKRQAKKQKEEQAKSLRLDELKQKDLIKRQFTKDQLNLLKQEQQHKRDMEKQDKLIKEYKRKKILKQKTLSVEKGEYLGSGKGNRWTLKNNGRVIFQGHPKERIIRIARKRGYIVSEV